MAANAEQLKMALPSPPFVNVQGVDNLRDIGGYQTSFGYYTRRGLVYRSADLETSPNNKKKKLKSLDISAVFDLRSKHEVEKAEAADKQSSNDTYERWKSLPNGPKYNFVPVFEDDDYSPEALVERFRDYASEGTKVSHQILH